jgi:hypothetical protein
MVTKLSCGPLLIETQCRGLEIAFDKNGVGHGEEKGFFLFLFVESGSSVFINLH